MKDLTHLILPDLKEMLPEMNREAIEATFEDFHPADTADILENMDDAEAVKVFEALPLNGRVKAFEHLEEPGQLRLLERVGRDKMIKVIEQMSSDDRVDLLQALPQRTVDSILPLLAQAERNDIKNLLKYEEGTAGAVMTTEYASLRAEMNVADALAHLRKIAPERETIYEIYVIDGERHLLGRLGLRGLVLSKPDQIVSDLMSPPPYTVHVEDDQETVVRAFEKYDVLAIPVLDAGEKLVGIVTHDDVIDIIEEEATEDVQRLGAVETLDEPYLRIRIARMVRKRAGWLTALFLGEMLTATAMSYFQAEIERAVVLALFLPLIISSGGNSGSQATTLVIRAMALGEIKLRDWWHVARREVVAGLGLGTILGTIGLLRILVWQAVDERFFHKKLYGQHAMLVALTVGLSLVGVVLWGSLAGSMLPFLLRRLGFDPASASAPFVATLVDVSGLIIYFTVASLILLP